MHLRQDVDGRDKPGHDGSMQSERQLRNVQERMILPA
jgi:hypothetical protein